MLLVTYPYSNSINLRWGKLKFLMADFKLKISFSYLPAPGEGNQTMLTTINGHTYTAKLKSNNMNHYIEKNVTLKISL